LELDDKNNYINGLGNKITKLQNNLSEMASINYLADKLISIEKNLKNKDLLIEELNNKILNFEEINNQNKQTIAKLELILKTILTSNNEKKITLDELKKKFVTKII